MREEILNWLAQGNDDLEKAEVLFDKEKFDGAAFFCQQAVEKCLKALFIFKKSKSAGQTHSLVFLGKELGVPSKHFELLQDLTSEFVTTRYPDVVGEVPFRLYGKQKVYDYILKSKELIEWASHQIKKP